MAATTWLYGLIGKIIRSAGVDMAAEPAINFTGSGVTVTDDPTNKATVVTIAAGGAASFPLTDASSPGNAPTSGNIREPTPFAMRCADANVGHPNPYCRIAEAAVSVGNTTLAYGDAQSLAAWLVGGDTVGILCGAGPSADLSTVGASASYFLIRNGDLLHAHKLGRWNGSNPSSTPSGLEMSDSLVSGVTFHFLSQWNGDSRIVWGEAITAASIGQNDAPGGPAVVTGAPFTVYAQGGTADGGPAVLKSGAGGTAYGPAKLQGPMDLGLLLYSFPSNANQVLTPAQSANNFFDISTGAAGADRTITVSRRAASAGQAHFKNRTAFNITIQWLTGAGVVMAAGDEKWIGTDGTNAKDLSGNVVAWTPAAISGILSWHRADLGVTQAAGTVSAWANQSGSGDTNRNAVNASGATQPSAPAANAKLNGQLSIGFTTAQRLVTGVYSTAPSAPLTIIIVFSDGANNKFLIDSLAADAQACKLKVDNVNGFALGGTTSLFGSAYDLAGHATIGLLNGASSSERKDNMTTTDVTGTTTFAATGFTFGNDSGFGSGGSNIAEVIIVNGNLSSGDKGSLRTYLQARYALTIGA